MESLKELKVLSKELTVLYVEDDTQIAKTIINYLSKFFKEVLFANNGEQGLELYKEKPCDLVITDIKMPRMHGLDMSFHIKQINPEQNIVVISAYSEVENFLRSIKLGIDGYVLKPVDYTDLNKLLFKMSTRITALKNSKLYLNRVSLLIEELSLKNDELKHYTNALNKVAVVSKADLKGYITFVNDFFCDVSGYTREELIGQNHNIIRHPDVPKSVFKQMWESIQSGNIWEGHVKNRAKNNEPYYVHATIIPLYEKDGKTIKEYIGIRFLTTANEEEKREFKKRVMLGYQEFRKENFAYKKRIEELENDLIQAKNQVPLNPNAVENKNKQSQLLNQIKFYENEIQKTQEKHNNILQKTKENNQQITESYKKSLQLVDKQKERIEFLENADETRSKEIIRLEDEVKDQRRIIADLRATIDTIANEEKPEKKNSLFKKLL